ncbi:carbon-nitrogen family hydrolase [Nesterenkonia ebinurensis]|uniref:carbon-nitrogen family hydrolase n=1 Tax=Nesterenkonia ebinurensis TaxID=2608252 RepID=UPI00123DF126|nr:carbon-nitrogen family hydrolase [Nesterenkonia ebinurensis]
MKIALLQIASPRTESPDARRNRVLDQLHAAPQADLYMLPELWPGGFFAFDAYADLAETDQGPTLTALKRVATELNAFIHGGSYVETAGTSLRNTAVLISPIGEVISRYSKIHGFGHQSEERERMAAGDTLDIAETPYGRASSTTCYDLRFPGLWSRLADGGADLIFVPAAWPAIRRDHWRLLTSARAVENQAFVIACNAAGEQAGVQLAGTSRVVSPWGELLAEAGSEEETLLVEIDPAEVNRIREEFPVLRDRLDNYETVRLTGTPRL